MTDMTACLVLMDPMGYYILCFSLVNLLVTIQTLWPIFRLIPVCIFLAIAMHLIPCVALVTFHILLPVDTGLGSLILTKILLPYASPVAGNTDLLHGRFPLIEMTVQKSAFNRIRPADMTLAATAVAMITMIFPG